MPRPCHVVHDLQPPGVCRWCDYDRDPENPYHKLWAGEPVSAPPPAHGPGTELKKLLADLGVSASSGCGCEDKANQMNTWGVQGCRDRRDEIIGWLREQFQKLGWGTAAMLAVRAVLKTKSADPAGTLVDEAIRLAEEKERERGERKGDSLTG